MLREIVSRQAARRDQNEILGSVLASPSRVSRRNGERLSREARQTPASRVLHESILPSLSFQLWRS